ncbi:uncharacterized protein Z520_12241 [Fonsecaea multimorphosa CBS 102226]|uniref:Uncharacterized protein n=1 Tax=Fonsecaea multimorphosa CBS 102226 TaxID=1442371 RepID=A0A0D2I3Z7_9EURO|nr:uncharacterized protein Z520_12241 [Fonsecaea multimorphosa CBS 102226]KIX92026.1 hypothetical protein Z520_12241 [Fonsecaea multimorphosa CBS 102226]
MTRSAVVSIICIVIQPSFSYTALSYVWGDGSQEGKVNISCNGRQARITPNLPPLGALPAAQFKHQQNSAPTAKDLAEKEQQQVRMMDRTFSMAEPVGAGSAPEVLSTLDRIHNVPEEVWEAAGIAGITATI